MRKKRKVFNDAVYSKSLAIKGETRPQVKLDALKSRGGEHANRKKEAKRGKVKHKATLLAYA